MSSKEESGDVTDLVVENEDDMTIAIPSDLNGYNVIEPFKFVSNKDENSSLVILNQKIEGIKLLELWDHTNLHICADGGANRLYTYLEEEGVDYKLYKPDFIVGDLDSLDPEIQKKYKDLGVIIIPQLTQYASDFMKAINIVTIFYHSEQARKALYGDINEHDGLHTLLETLTTENSSETLTINNYILNGLGGRFDQTIHSINQILKLKQQYPNLKNFFITNQDLVFLINKGHNLVKYDNKTQFFDNKTTDSSINPVCGLLPLNKPVVLSTQGLKWDVTKWHSSMDGNVSSSNAITSNNGIIVSCSDDLIINIEMNY